MPDRRGRRGSEDDLIPRDRFGSAVPWARAIWRDKKEVAKTSAGAWMLRRAADELQIDQEEVDRLLGSGRG